MSLLDEELCPHCGEPAIAGVFELWTEDRAFMPDFCCEAAQEEWLWEAQFWGDAEWKQFFASEADVRVRGVVEGACGLPVIDFGLRVEPIEFAIVTDFVRRHHKHCRPTPSWRYGAGCVNGTELIAVVVVGRPTARHIDQHRKVEVRRLCVNHDLAPGLTRHACSLLYGWAAREAKRRGFEAILTYTREDEPGTSLRAAGWVPVAMTKLERRGWDRPGRRRAPDESPIRKVRWEKALAPGVAPLTPIALPARLPFGEAESSCPGAGGI